LAKRKQHIDEFFRDRIGGIEMPATEGDFNAIMDGLGSARGKRRGLWWILAGVALVGILASWLLLRNTEESNPVSLQTEQTHDRIIESQSSPSAIKLSEEPENITRSESDQDEEGDNERAYQERAQQDFGSPKVTEANVQQSPDEVNRNSERANSTATGEQGVVPNEPSGFSPVVEIVEQEQEQASPDKVESNDQQGEEPAKDDNTVDGSTPSKGQNPTEPNTETVLNKALDTTTVNSAATSLNPLPWTPWIRISGGVGSPSFTGISAVGDRSKYEELKANEIGQVGLNLDFDAGIQKGHFSFESGLNYDEFNFENSQFKAQMYDSFPLLSPLGDTIAWFRNNYRDSAFGNPQRTQYQILSIPVRATYSWDLGNAWRIRAGAGVRFSMNIGQTGNTIDHNSALIHASEIPLKDLMLGYDLNFMTQYAIKPNWYLGLELGYYNTIGGAYQNSSSASVDMRNTNLKMSLTYELK